MAERRPLIEVRRSKIHGRGVFALRTIRRGTRMIEYLGERISQKEADRRYPADELTGMTVLFHVDRRTVIDGGAHGNDARYINHSCEPNCESLMIDDRVHIIATQTIRAGTELTYDYHLMVDDPYDVATASRLYPCRCGAEDCRGTMARIKTRRAPREARPRTAARRPRA